jgi:amino acid transporter
MEGQRLERTLRPRDVVLFLVTAGVNLQWVATAAASGPQVMVLWIAGMLTMSLPLARCVIRLSARFPDEGGLYVWSRQAFGEFGGFLSGWTYWMSNLPYFPGVLYFAAANGLFLAGERYRHLSSSPAYFIVFSLLALAAALWMNIAGWKVARVLSNLGAHARLAGAFLLIALGALAFFRFGSATTLTSAAVTPHFDLHGIVFWSTIAFALTGLEAVSFMGGEIQDAARVVPRAILVALPINLLIYYLGTLSVLVALPVGQVSGLQGIVDAVAAMGNRLGMHGVLRLMAGILLFHCLGSVGAWLGAVARIPYVAGLDRVLPKGFGRLHPRFGTPHLALWTQALVTVLFIFMGQAGTSVKGAYEVLVNQMVIITLVPFLFLYGAALRLPLDDTLWGRAVTRGFAALGMATTAAAIVLSFVPSADEPNKPLALLKIAGVTGLLIGSGLVVYFIRGSAPGGARPKSALDEFER